MKSTLRNAWSRLLGSLWFVPGMMVLAAMALAVAMVELSANMDGEALARWPRVFGASADSSRSLLSAIAGSMITVAGVTFSITMVAVTQASSQYTPRILRNFMRDRANQVVLGAFVGIFAYCLVVLRTIRSGDDLTFVPSLAVLLGLLLAVVGIAMLIFFVHHIATTLQASGIIARVTRETVATVDKLFPEELGDEASGATPPAALATAASAPRRAVPACSTGYVQSLDADELMRAAVRYGVVVTMEVGIGDFVIEGAPLGWLTRPDASAARRNDAGDDPDEPRTKVASLFTVSSYRTVDQDAGFGVRQIVDIALKALSPGVNDTTTAVSCVDYLGAILVRVATRRVETPFRADDEGVVRVVAREPTFEGLLRAAVDEIRQNATGNVSVLAALFTLLTSVGRSTRAPVRQALLREQVDLVREVVTATVRSAHDRARLEALADDARRAALTDTFTGRAGGHLGR